MRHADGGMMGEVGKSESHPVMGWIEVEVHMLSNQHHQTCKGSRRPTGALVRDNLDNLLRRKRK